MVEKGVGWDSESLHEFLENPKKFVPGNKMFFPGLKKERERTGIAIFYVNPLLSY